jgi:hypothetical protein
MRAIKDTLKRALDRRDQSWPREIAAIKLLSGLLRGGVLATRREVLPFVRLNCVAQVATVVNRSQPTCFLKPLIIES